MSQNTKDVCKNTEIASTQQGKIHNSLYPIKMYRHIKKQKNITHKEEKKMINFNQPGTDIELAAKIQTIIVTMFYTFKKLSGDMALTKITIPIPETNYNI